jgi:hypothetical protein
MYAKQHPADTYIMFNPATEATSETHDVNTWAEWKHVDPKDDMSIFNKYPELLIEPMGIGDKEVTEPFEPPEAGINLIDSRY